MLFQAGVCYTFVVSFVPIFLPSTTPSKNSPWVSFGLIFAVLLFVVSIGAHSFLSAGTVASVDASVAPTQTSAESLRAADRISASWRRTPVAGRLLVLVVGAEASTHFSAPAGWKLAVESAADTSPSQAIYYKIATTHEPMDVLVRADVRSDMGLQLYEYTQINTVDPFIRAVAHSDTSTSASVDGGMVDVTPALLVAGVVTDQHTSLGSSWDDGFAVQHAFHSFGASASFGSAAQVVASRSPLAFTAPLGRKSVAWTGVVAAFRRSEIGLRGAASDKTLPDLQLRSTATPLLLRGFTKSRVVLTLANAGTVDAHDVEIAVQIPNSMRVDTATATSGGFVLASGIWKVGTVPAGKQANLQLTVSALPDTDTSGILTAEVDLLREEEHVINNNETAIRFIVEGPDGFGSCPDISKATASAVAPPTGDWILQTVASGATRLLVGDTPDRNEAFLRAPGRLLVPPTFDGDFYVWFGNACQFGAPVHVIPTAQQPVKTSSPSSRR